jgi:hypothetical protein
MADTGSYLYAVTRRAVDADLSGSRGLRDEPLRVVQHAGLAAVVSTVGLEEFGEEGLAIHLEDLAWLEEVARAHDAVVSATAALGPTAPLRLATICLNDDAVRERLDLLHVPLKRALDRVEGRREWSVKAFAPLPMAAEVPLDSHLPAEGSLGAGAAYLMRRKAEQAQRERAGEVAANLADELHAALSAPAAASRRLTPQDPRLSGLVGTMILNGAYLVDEADGSAFVEEAQRLSMTHPDARLDIRGPWPPYSFVTLAEP